ncbi:MAG: cytochrome c biogenesis protein CcsA [Nitrospirota bacterium]
MQLLQYEAIFHWTAVFFYAVATVVLVYGIFFQKDQRLNTGIRIAIAGLLPHTAALGVRWYAAGHGPYLSRLEGFSSIAWVVIIMFAIFAFRVPKLKALGIIIFPASFIIMTVGLFSAHEIKNLPPTFHSIWLWVHIGFTKLAAGSLLIALGSAVFFLLKKTMGEEGFFRKISSLEVLDTYSYKFAGLGFVAWSISVASGAIWANESWGRYWGWDPIETWSLITWLLFGMYLHLRRFFRWKGEKAAVLMIVCFVFSMVTLFVIPFVVDTIHTEFFL